MARLGVNIDHVATIRQARRTIEPDPVWAAALAELAGADVITVHLREDRRHIQDRDVRALRPALQTRMNLEIAATPEKITSGLPQAFALKPKSRIQTPWRKPVPSAFEIASLAANRIARKRTARRSGSKSARSSGMSRRSTK